MIDRERTMKRIDGPPHPLVDGNDRKIGRMTAHFWVGDRLYEVSYDPVVRGDGGTGLVRVPDSERRCQCPGRDDAEQGRRAGTRSVPRSLTSQVR
jgi:hypothetical protein